MDKYSNYKCVDFASDEEFIRWVLHPDVEADAFWTKFIRTNPESESHIYDARLIVESMRFEDCELPALEQKQLWKCIDKSVQRKSVRIRYISAAACVACVVAAAWWSLSLRTDVRHEDNLLAFVRSAAQPLQGSEIQVVVSDEIAYTLSGPTADLRYDREGLLLLNESNEKARKFSAGNMDERSFHQVLVPRGRRLSITFSDGSRLWLNADSKAVYPVAFGKRREIYVEGEAYFEVARDEKRPFVVKTQEAAVTVLGTKFNLSNYPDNDRTSLVLAEGSVAVAWNGRETTLLPDQMINFYRGTQQHEIKNVDACDYVCWKDGFLQLRSDNLYNILQKLEKRYAVYFVLDKTMEKHIRESNLSGKLELKENLAEVLRTIGRILPVKCDISIVNHQVIIHKKE
jgi:ferric-dicitrate binding protein FerR (iron transport regulator)